MSKKPILLCGGQTGRAVLFGWVDEIPEVDKPCELADARMVLYWPKECGGLLGLAANGPKKGLRLTETVSLLRDTCRQVITVSDDAAKLLKDWTND